MCGAFLAAREDERVKQVFHSFLSGIEKYRADSETLFYRSTYAGCGDGDPFYDDNVWIAIEFLRAWELTGNDDWYRKCLSLASYVYSGYDVHGGAIVWKPTEKTLNGCTNAPAAALSARLYIANGDSQYLVWAEKLYSWCEKKLYDDDEGCFFDHVRLDGTLDRSKYSYVTGMMISAAVWLYKATNRADYLYYADKYAKEGISRFVKSADGQLQTQPHPWFNMKLLHGLSEAEELTGDDYTSAFRSVIDKALINAKLSNGYYSVDWATRESDDCGQDILEQAGFCECLSIIGGMNK